MVLLPAPGIDAAHAIRVAADDIVSEALERQWSRWPGLRETFSESQLAHARQDTRYHVDFLATALWAGDQVLFDDYVLWVRVLFENLGLPEEWLTGSLADVASAVGAAIDPAHAAAATRVVERALETLPYRSTGITSQIAPERPHAALAMRYLGAALGGDRHEASRTILDAVERGVPVRDIYLHVFEPVQLELGRLWQTGKITVAQEHFVTGVTQLVMARLYPYIFGSGTNGRTLVAACVGHELHEMGLRMVADFFEMEEWGTHFIGANTPVASIVDAVAGRHADVLGLSATMAYHVPEVANVIDALRADERTRDVPVIVGGYPFNLSPGLWERVGADGYAPDAPSAIRTASELVSGARR